MSVRNGAYGSTLQKKERGQVFDESLNQTCFENNKQQETGENSRKLLDRVPVKEMWEGMERDKRIVRHGRDKRLNRLELKKGYV